MHAIGADLERVQRQPQVVDRRGQRDDLVNKTHSLINGRTAGRWRIPRCVNSVEDVLDVRQRASLEIAHTDDELMPPREQLFAQMRAGESRSTSH